MVGAMSYNPRVHRRRSIRLPAYDYGQAGAYFVTICAYRKECLFEDEEFRTIAESVWQAVAPSAGGTADEFIVMPNHVHGIIWIVDRAV